MIFTKWNWDDALEVAREEGREDGLEEGRQEGRKEGRQEGRQEGRKESWQYFSELLNQGLTIEEIKQRLNK